MEDLNWNHAPIALNFTNQSVSIHLFLNYSVRCGFIRIDRGANVLNYTIRTVVGLYVWYYILERMETQYALCSTK